MTIFDIFDVKIVFYGKKIRILVESESYRVLISEYFKNLFGYYLACNYNPSSTYNCMQEYVSKYVISIFISLRYTRFSKNQIKQKIN